MAGIRGLFLLISAGLITPFFFCLMDCFSNFSTAVTGYKTLLDPGAWKYSSSPRSLQFTIVDWVTLNLPATSLWVKYRVSCLTSFSMDVPLSGFRWGNIIE